MRHPFDGIVNPENESIAPRLLSRRAALGSMFAAAAGLFGAQSALALGKEIEFVPVTDAIGEGGGGPAGMTTLAKNEEGGAFGGLTNGLREGGGMTKARGGAEGGMGMPAAGTVDLPADKMEAAWNDLKADDLERMMKGVMALYSSKSTVSYLKGQLKAEQLPMDSKRFGQLLKEMDDNSWDVREKATAEVAKMGLSAMTELDRQMQGKHSVEVLRRIDAALEQLREQPNVVQMQRGIEVLVLINSTDSKALVDSLAQANPETWMNAVARHTRVRMTGK